MSELNVEAEGTENPTSFYLGAQGGSSGRMEQDPRDPQDSSLTT